MTTSKLHIATKRLEPVEEVDLMKLHEELATFDIQVKSKELRLFFLTLEEKEVALFVHFEEDHSFDIAFAYWLLP